MSKAIPKYLARCNTRFDKESEDFFMQCLCLWTYYYSIWFWSIVMMFFSSILVTTVSYIHFDFIKSLSYFFCYIMMYAQKTSIR